MTKKLILLFIVLQFLTNTAVATNRTFTCNKDSETISRMIEANWEKIPDVGYISNVSDTTTGVNYEGWVRSQVKKMPEDKNPHLTFERINRVHSGGNWMIICNYTINNSQMFDGETHTQHLNLSYQFFDKDITFCKVVNDATALECS